MGRGKPFSKSVKRLVGARVISKPAWMSVVEATRPSFRPISDTRIPQIGYPEDRVRDLFLQKNRFARRIPVNMKADTVYYRHLADRFVDVRTKLMKRDKLNEDEADDAALHVLKSGSHDPQYLGTEEIQCSLSDQKVANEAAHLYIASLRDSKRDKALYQALSRQAEDEIPKDSTSL